MYVIDKNIDLLQKYHYIIMTMSIYYIALIIYDMVSGKKKVYTNV